MADYIIYYRDANDEAEGYGVAGSRRVVREVRWIKSIGGTVSQILKKGRNFSENPEDVIDVTKSYV